MIAATALSGACGRAADPPARAEASAAASPSSAPAAEPAPAQGPQAPELSREDREFKELITAFARAAGGGGPAAAVKFPEGLTVEGACPAAPASDEEMAAQASAIVPLKVDLTLSSLWRAEDDDYDIECLTQVLRVEPNAVSESTRCSLKNKEEGGSRRTCRTDLRDAYMFHPGVGPQNPERIEGATAYVLSTRSFAELKSAGATRHRNVLVTSSTVYADLDGQLVRQGSGTVPVIVNDRLVDLPVIRASGRFSGTLRGEKTETRIDAAILDDDRFPLVLDYRAPDLDHFLTFAKISFPIERGLEKRLAAEQRIDVYGIYFDFASDRLRAESQPVILEIVNALLHNPDWKLTIDGHTDNVGGDAFNLDLSRRRSAAVRKALTDSGISPSRLTTGGHGAAIPRDTNETAKGRARNRRVELFRY